MPHLASRLFTGAALTATMLTAIGPLAADPATASVTPAIAASSTTASDSGDVAWSMIPAITDVGAERSNFSYALEPGETVEDAVMVRNSGATALSLAVYGSDAFTDDAGALDISTAETGSTDVGQWITPATERIEIAPGGIARLPFSVTVPADAQPGEHAGALLTVRQSTGDTVSVDMRYATRVTVAVAGKLTAGLSLDDASLAVTTGFWPWEPASAHVSYGVHNTGNTRLSAAQLITAPGVELYSTPGADAGLATLSELLPDAVVAVDATVDGLSAWSPLADVSVSVSPTVLAGAGGATLAAEQQQLALSATAIAPGWWVMIAAAGAVTLFAIRFARRRRVTPPSTPQ